MSHTQHTPGPWSTYRGEDTNYWWIIRDAEGHELGSGDGGFEKADAHLIAAAPAMLAALRAMIGVTINSGQVSDDMAPVLEMALAAIKQATGEAE